MLPNYIKWIKNSDRELIASQLLAYTQFQCSIFSPNPELILKINFDNYNIGYLYNIFL